MVRPIIGITGELDAARWGDWVREAVVSPVSYIRAVDRSGGAPLVLPPVPPDSVAAFIAVLDGLVFTGGRDLDPSIYDQQRLEETDEPEHRRDRFELALMRAALEPAASRSSRSAAGCTCSPWPAAARSPRTCPATAPTGRATCRTTWRSAPTASLAAARHQDHCARRASPGPLPASARG